MSGEYLRKQGEFAEAAAKILHEDGVLRLKQLVQSGSDGAAVSALKLLADRSYGGVEARTSVDVSISYTETLRRVSEIARAPVIDAEVVEVKQIEHQPEADDEFDC